MCRDVHLHTQHLLYYPKTELFFHPYPGKWAVLASQHLGTIICDGYGVLEVGAVAAVDGDGGPTILEDADFGAARVKHRLDGEDHAGLEAGAFTGVAEVGHLGVFVHGATNSVADELADHAETL